MLRKQPAYTLVPAVPSIPYRSAQTTCPSDPPSGPGGGNNGQWMTVCSTISVIWGWDYGPPRFDEPGPFPKPLYTHAMTCRSEWVPG